MRRATGWLLLVSVLLATAARVVVHAQTGTNCLLTFCPTEPCKTDACKAKCGAYANDSVQCVNNFCGGCTCDCVLPAKAPCKDDPDSPPCAKGYVCDQSNTCVVNPFTQNAACPTICVLEEEAASSCKQAGRACVPLSATGKPQCCDGLGCHWSKSASQFICSKCHGLGVECVTRPCCPFLSCQQDSKLGYVCKAAFN